MANEAESRNSRGQQLRDRIDERERRIKDYEQQCKAVYRSYSQDKYWADDAGNIWRVEDLSKRHLLNILLFLEARAAVLESYFSYGELLCMSPAMIEAFEKYPDFEVEQEREWKARVADPVAWLNSTPLVKKLRKIFDEWENDGQFASMSGLEY